MRRQVLVRLSDMHVALAGRADDKSLRGEEPSLAPEAHRARRGHGRRASARRVDPTLHGDSGALRTAAIEKMTRSGYYVGNSRAFVRRGPWRRDADRKDG